MPVTTRINAWRNRGACEVVDHFPVREPHKIVVNNKVEELNIGYGQFLSL
jgi:hypothetical protein